MIRRGTIKRDKAVPRCMRRAKLVRYQEIVVEDASIPQAGAGEALVATRFCGICGTDVAIYLGRIPSIKPPIVLGHEASGIVEEVGEGVSGVKRGDRIVVEPLITCGSCYNCLKGNYNQCEKRRVIGIDVDGAFSEYFKAPAERLHPISDNLPFEIAALAEPLSVAIHAVRRARVSSEDHVVVIGDGTIGLLTGFASKLVGGAEVAILGKHDHKLNLAKKLGVENVVNILKEDPAEKLRSIYDRIDVFFDCVGHSAETVNQALKQVRKGGRVVAVGVFPEAVETELGILQDRELELIGASAYTSPDFKRSINLLAERKSLLSSLITKTYALGKIDEAFRYAISDREHSVKLMIEVSGS